MFMLTAGLLVADKANAGQAGTTSAAMAVGLIRVWWMSVVVLPSASFSLKSGPVGVFKDADWPIVLVGRVFTNGPGDLGSIQGWVIPKTQKMVLDTSLLNITHYKACIKGKAEQSRERSNALLYTTV